MSDLLDTLRKMNMVLVDRHRYAELLGAELALGRVHDLCIRALAPAPEWGEVDMLHPDDVLRTIDDEEA